MSAKKDVTKSLLQSGGKPEFLALEKLLLDEENPRFGGSQHKFRGQADVLDWIVANFGIEDVISSLAINDYFEAEPLVVEAKGDGSYIVREGNRRLAACLILAKDPRAKNQERKRDSVAKNLRTDWGLKKQIPAISFDSSQSKKLTAYLGVRHIVSSQPWDSYAKAAWISKVVDENELSLHDISSLTGDKSQTIAKLLEGYNFIRQLEQRSLFDPGSSYKRGRGSNVDFPFSWIYTILQYSGVRSWLKLESYGTSKNPIPHDREKDAALTLEYMFGNKTSGLLPKIGDSRDLGRLAYVLTVPESRELLRQGSTVDQVEEMTRPVIDRLMSLLIEAREHMRGVNSILAEKPLPKEDALATIEVVRDIRKSGTSAFKALSSIVDDEGDDE